jgi:hypothetical protein
MEDVLIYGPLVYLRAILYISWPLGLLCGHLVYISPILVFCTKKSGNPAVE